MERGVLAGKSPISLVASCLYLVSSLSADPKPAKSIAEVAGCTEPTLRNAYRLLFKEKEILAGDLNLAKDVNTLVA
jgi:transcription initiation factor TFIIB